MEGESGITPSSGHRPVVGLSPNVPHMDDDTSWNHRGRAHAVAAHTGKPEDVQRLVAEAVTSAVSGGYARILAQAAAMP